MWIFALVQSWSAGSNIGSPNVHWLWRWLFSSVCFQYLILLITIATSVNIQILDHPIFIGCGADDGAVPKSHAYTNTSTALINDASEWTFLRGKIYLWWCWEVSVLKWFTFCSNTTISPNIFHFLCKIASIPLCRIEMKTWWHTGNWIGTNFIRYPISDAKCPHLSNPPSRTCWCHATTQSDRIKCNRILSRSLGYRWE